MQKRYERKSGAVRALLAGIILEISRGNGWAKGLSPLVSGGLREQSRPSPTPTKPDIRAIPGPLTLPPRPGPGGDPGQADGRLRGGHLGQDQVSAGGRRHRLRHQPGQQAGRRPRLRERPLGRERRKVRRAISARQDAITLVRWHAIFFLNKVRIFKRSESRATF